MATLGKGITFGSTEQITSTKLHNLVDLGSVSGIVDADCSASMNLANSKLAQITTYDKVTGAALSNLSSIATSAGFVPRNIFVTSLGSGGTIRWNGSNAWYASQT